MCVCVCVCVCVIEGESLGENVGTEVANKRVKLIESIIAFHNLRHY